KRRSRYGEALYPEKEGVPFLLLPGHPNRQSLLKKAQRAVVDRVGLAIAVQRVLQKWIVQRVALKLVHLFLAQFAIEVTLNANDVITAFHYFSMSVWRSMQILRLRLPFWMWLFTLFRS